MIGFLLEHESLIINNCLLFSWTWRLSVATGFSMKNFIVFPPLCLCSETEARGYGLFKLNQRMMSLSFALNIRKIMSVPDVSSFLFTYLYERVAAEKMCKCVHFVDW